MAKHSRMNKKRYHREKLTLDIGDDVEPEIAYVDFEPQLLSVKQQKMPSNINVRKANLENTYDHSTVTFNENEIHRKNSTTTRLFNS